MWQTPFSLCSAKDETDHVSHLFSEDFVFLELILLAFPVTSDFCRAQEMLCFYKLPSFFFHCSGGSDVLVRLSTF